MGHIFTVDNRLPKIVVAVAAAVGAVYAPSLWLKGLLAGVATASAIIVLGATEAGNAADRQEEPHWRTLKTYRVEA